MASSSSLLSDPSQPWQFVEKGEADVAKVFEETHQRTGEEKDQKPRIKSRGFLVSLILFPLSILAALTIGKTQQAKLQQAEKEKETEQLGILGTLRALVLGWYGLVGTTCNNLIDRVTNLVKLGLQGYNDNFQACWVFILSTFQQMMSDYYNFFSTSMDNFVNKTTELIKIGLQGYNENFQACWVFILSTFQQMMSDYYNFFSTSMDNFVNKTTNLIAIGLRGYFDTFSTCWTVTVGTFGELGSKLGGSCLTVAEKALEVTLVAVNKSLDVFLHCCDLIVPAVKIVASGYEEFVKSCLKLTLTPFFATTNAITKATSAVADHAIEASKYILDQFENTQLQSLKIISDLLKTYWQHEETMANNKKKTE